MIKQVYYTDYDGINKLNGTISLIKSNGFNIDDEIKTASSSVYDVLENPQNTLDAQGYFTSGIEDNSWISYYFVNKKIYLKRF